MTTREAHIEIASYTVTVGMARVTLKRDEAGWVLTNEATDRPFWFTGVGADGHDHMMRVATEYARQLDEVIQMRDAADAAEHRVAFWLRDQIRVPE